jgi:hypothetical protein
VYLRGHWESKCYCDSKALELTNLQFCQMFAVVEFLDSKFEGQCQQVPYTWILSTQDQCYWPPKGTNEKRAITSMMVPGEDWITLRIKVVYVTGKICTYRTYAINYRMFLGFLCSQYPYVLIFYMQ